MCADSVVSPVGLLGNSVMVPEAGARRPPTGWEAANSAGAAPMSHPLQPAFTCASPRPICRSQTHACSLFETGDAPMHYADRGLSMLGGSRDVVGGAICGHACCGVDGALDSPGQRRHAPCRSDILKKPGALGVTLVGGSLAAADAASGIWGELTPRLQLSLDALDAMLVRCHCMACRPATPKTLAKQPNAIVMYAQTRQSCTMRGGGCGQAPAVLCIWRRPTLAPCSSCPVDPTLASEMFARPPPTLPPPLPTTPAP